MEDAAWITRRHSRTRNLRRKRRDTEDGFPKFAAAVYYMKVSYQDSMRTYGRWYMAGASKYYRMRGWCKMAYIDVVVVV